MTVTELIARAETLAKQDNSQEAIVVLYEQWLIQKGGELISAPIWFNLGVAYARDSETAKAVECYSKAIILMPTLWQAIANLGNYYETSKQVDKAIALYEKSLSTSFGDDGKIFISNQLGRLYENAGEFKKAIAQYWESLSKDSNQKDAFQHWFFLKQKQCDWPLMALPKPLTVNEFASSLGTLSSMAYFDDPSLLNLACKEWVRRYKEGKHFYHLCSGEERYDHKKIRIGYVSGDFRMHAVCFLSAQMYELHDRSKFEVYGFDFSIDDQSPWRKRVINGMDHFHLIHDLSGEEAAKLIKSLEIDILVDMVGLTAGGRPDIFLFKPAPIQMSYLGFLGPVGMEEIDYLVCDRYVVPEEVASEYGAKPLYMPFYQINNQLRQSANPPSRKSQGLPDDAFVFCAINNRYKITQELFSRWMLILKQTHDSVLWLLEGDANFKENILRQARLYQVDTERLIFAKPIHPAMYLARFQCADLFLDTSPYNAGITAADAIWMGLPVLTCPGKTFVSRMAADLLLQLNLDPFVCNSWREYIDRATHFSKTRSSKIVFNQLFDRNNPVFDSASFVRDWEQRLIDIQKNHV